MKDHNVCRWWSTSMLFFILLLSYILNVSVLANSSLPNSLQHSQTLCHDHEKLALLHFKQSFLIDCSVSHSAFAHPKVKSWRESSLNDHVANGTSGGDCCRWDGVECNGETGHVIGLNLSSSCLYGTFPSNSTIFGLAHLLQLDLSDNDFNSSQIPSIISNFTSLEYLNLTGSNLYGYFPTDVFLLPNLEKVILQSNSMLRGQLPEFPSNGPLRVLNLGETSFFGELSPSVGNLGNLTELTLRKTGFTGSIPSSLGNLTNLTILDFSECSFIGDMPLQVTNLTQLTELYLSNVNVRHEIVNSWLLELNKLEVLSLNNMNISCEFPPAVANLTKLNLLDFFGNQLRGPLPNWLVNLTNLWYLDLTGNQFQGPLIPQWFSQLINLEALSLSSNSSSVAMFDPLLKLPKLNHLEIRGFNLKFPPNSVTTNSSFPKFSSLVLISCNLTNFPQILHHQSELKLLSLSKNKIVGSIPQWFVNTTAKSLVMLYLESNFITGFEKPQVFLPWKNLELLYIQNNKLRGRLPSPPPSLKIYLASQNYLSSVDPKQFCKGSSLVSLDLSRNNFSGRIPSCICLQLSASLKVLNLGSNNFQGTIPQAFPRGCKLQMIDLSDNELEGQLPKSLNNCEQLQVLKVGNNYLKDTFPSWMGSLPNLQILLLRQNNFHGRITTLVSDHQFNRLHILDLSNNFYVGNIPSKFLQNLLAMGVTSEGHMKYSSFNIDFSLTMNDLTWQEPIEYLYSINITNKGTEMHFAEVLTVLRVLDFSSNKFTGVIPDVIGNLRGLQVLNLSNNHLVGDIPSSLTNIGDLQSLDLSQNKLSGEIPEQLTKLTSLEVFNVSHNHLVGLIPQGHQFNTFDNNSFDGNVALCGPPLSKKCRNTDSLQPPRPSDTQDEKEEESMLIDWIIRLLGCASGCIVGFIIGKLYITDRHHDWFMETFESRPKPNTRRSAPSAGRHG